jgi:hypothetical protein
MDKLTKRRLSILKELMERQELAKSTIQKKKKKKNRKKDKKFSKEVKEFLHSGGLDSFCHTTATNLLPDSSILAAAAVAACLLACLLGGWAVGRWVAVAVSLDNASFLPSSLSFGDDAHPAS